MTHHQMTMRLFLILVCLVLIGGLLYYYIQSGILALPFGSASTSVVPVAQPPAGVTSLIPSSTPASTHSATSSVPVAPTNIPPVSTVSSNPALLHSITITNADNAAAVSLTTGQKFALDLGSGLHWTIQFSPAANVAQVAASSTSAAQGVFKAVSPGTVELKATGAPICAPNQACPMFLAVFSTTLEVH